MASRSPRYQAGIGSRSFKEVHNRAIVHRRSEPRGRMGSPGTTASAGAGRHRGRQPDHGRGGGARVTTSFSIDGT